MKKPSHGSPCNNCGECCRAELCPLGVSVFRTVAGPCPALETRADDGQSACGLVAHPATYMPVRAHVYGKRAMSDAALILVGAGIGCDAQLESEPANEPFRAMLRRKRDSMRLAVGRACAVWGVAVS